jgi:hypothetical protein
VSPISDTERSSVAEEVFEGVDAGFNRLGVAAAHKDDNGDVMLPVISQDSLVATLQPFACEGEFAECVFASGVDPGLIENEVEVLWADFFECAIQAT